MGFDPATRTEGFVGLGEVLRPVAENVALIEAGVDEVEGGVEDPGVFDVVDSELVIVSGNSVILRGLK